MGMVPRHGKYGMMTMLPDSNKGYVQVHRKFEQYYYEAVMVMLQLTPSQKDMLQFALADVRSSNIVHLGAYFLTELNKVRLTEFGDVKPYKINTLRKNISRFMELQIIAKVGPGAYKLNPVLFYDEGTENRMEAIRIYFDVTNKGIELTIDEIY
jgi:hypothetical protein